MNRRRELSLFSWMRGYNRARRNLLLGSVFTVLLLGVSRDKSIMIGSRVALY